MNKKDDLPKSAKKLKRKGQDDDTNTLPGWPGYRTREGRSGLDPIDTRTEAAHMAGSILRRLFSGQIRNPVYLILVGILGLVLVTPLALAILEALNGNQFPWNAWIFLLITGIAGLVILSNFVKNLIRLITRSAG